MRTVTICLLTVGALCLANASAMGAAGETVARPSFKLWQLPSQTDTIGMSYVLRTIHGKLIVVDGGYSSDASYLGEFLKARGNKVEAWFITHAHDDHFDALAEIMRHPGSLSIKTIYGSLSKEEWVAQYEPDAVEKLRAFNAALRDAHKTVTGLRSGSTLEIDGVRVEVLGVDNPEIHTNAINNSSVVLRMSDSRKSILFLGDLGPEGGEKLLRGKYGSRIHTDYVQMAHHGQNGVAEAFYQAVRPSYCLWPTPRWLWDNNSGKGVNSGPWRTLEVRAWMAKLGVKHSYVSCIDGLSRID